MDRIRPTRFDQAAEGGLDNDVSEIKGMKNRQLAIPAMSNCSARSITSCKVIYQCTRHISPTHSPVLMLRREGRPRTLGYRVFQQRSAGLDPPVAWDCAKAGSTNAAISAVAIPPISRRRDASVSFLSMP